MERIETHAELQEQVQKAYHHTIRQIEADLQERAAKLGIDEHEHARQVKAGAKPVFEVDIVGPYLVDKDGEQIEVGSGFEGEARIRFYWHVVENKAAIKEYRKNVVRH